MQEIQPAPVQRHSLDRLHVDVFDHFRILLTERADGVDRDGENARHRAETEGDDEDQREYDIRNRAAELHEPLDDEAEPQRRRGVFSRHKIQRETQHGAGQRTDIADQNRFAEIERPFAPAPEPFADIGPDPLAVLQREDAIEITDEVAEIVKQRPQVHFRPDRGHDERR
jgi:hypothetical protein